VVSTLTILLAEDNPINRMIVKLGLEQRHHRVTVAENGAQAYEAAAGHRFDVILMDMQMPVMDGTDATRRIRSLPPPYSEVPIVALTADAISEHRAAYMEAGLTDFLTKPVEWTEVDAVFTRLNLGGVKRSAPIDGIDRVKFEDDPAPLLDRRRLLEIRAAMTPSAFNEMIRELIPYSRNEVVLLREATGEQNLPRVNRIAHGLKGMFIDIGAVRVADLAKGLQTCADLAAAETLLPTISATIHDTLVELERVSAVIAVPGLDARQALLRFGGNEETLRSMLARLAEMTVGLLETLRGTLKAGDARQAARCMHSLRGSAGNIGVVGLASLAGDIESAILDGRTGDLPNLLGNLEASAQAFRDGVKAIPGDAEKPDPLVASIDPERLSRLTALLREGNLAALDDYKSLGPLLKAALPAGRYDALVAAMEKLDFSAAATAIDLPELPSR
ncbi:MAG: response regulator, partial [Alphaproteobacteria bacterium]|nr:response regulator [Alphaproteobacteria bacterium]